MADAWKPYIVEMMKGGHVAQAFIAGAGDALVWTKSDGFAGLTTHDETVTKDDGSTAQVTINEQKELLALFANLDTTSSIWIAGKKYMVLSADSETKRVYFRSGKVGGCAAKTNQTILVGLFGAKGVAGDCNQAVERIADSLLAANY